MSQRRAVVEVSFTAGETLAAFRIVGPSSGTSAVQLWDTSTALFTGVTQDSSSGGTGSSVLVAIGGACKVVCDASVSAGAILTGQTATGLAIAGVNTSDTHTTTLPRSIGVALQAGSTNAVIEMLIGINNIQYK